MLPARNELCPCKSGWKAKRCCLPKLEALRGFGAYLGQHAQQAFEPQVHVQVSGPPDSLILYRKRVVLGEGQSDENLCLACDSVAVRNLGLTLVADNPLAELHSDTRIYFFCCQSDICGARVDKFASSLGL